jgi:hypothetical protein
MNRKEFLGIIGGMWILGFFSAISQERFIEESSSGGERVDIDELKKKAEEGQVSMKEAMFYEIFEEKNRSM